MARRQTPWYRKRPDLRGFNLSARDKHSAVSMEWGFTYIRIPKAANSTVGMTLDHHFPGSGRTDRVGRRAYRKLSRLNGDEARRVFEEHFIFSVVRNPYHRILSAYLDKIAPGEEARIGARFATEIRRSGGGDITFNAFCRWLSRGGLNRDIHWIPQMDILSIVGFERLDYIGHVETLQDDVPGILRRIAGDKDIRSDLVRAGPRPTKAAEKCRHYYDEEAFDIVRTLYGQDFERLEYDDSRF